jgi:hypothetical protein
MPIDVGLLGAVLSRLQQQENRSGGVLE